MKRKKYVRNQQHSSLRKKQIAKRKCGKCKKVKTNWKTSKIGAKVYSFGNNHCYGNTLMNANNLCVCRQCNDKRTNEANAYSPVSLNKSENKPTHHENRKIMQNKISKKIIGKNMHKPKNKITWVGDISKIVPGSNQEHSNAVTKYHHSCALPVKYRNGKKSKSLLRYVLKKQKVKQLASHDECSCCQKCIAQLMRFIKVEIARQGCNWIRKKTTHLKPHKTSSKKKTNKCSSKCKLPPISARIPRKARRTAAAKQRRKRRSPVKKTKPSNPKQWKPRKPRKRKHPQGQNTRKAKKPRKHLNDIVDNETEKSVITSTTSNTETTAAENITINDNTRNNELTTPGISTGVMMTDNYKSDNKPENLVTEHNCSTGRQDRDMHLPDADKLSRKPRSAKLNIKMIPYCKNTPEPKRPREQGDQITFKRLKFKMEVQEQNNGKVEETNKKHKNIKFEDVPANHQIKIVEKEKKVDATAQCEEDKQIASSDQYSDDKIDEAEDQDEDIDESNDNEDDTTGHGYYLRSIPTVSAGFATSLLPLDFTPEIKLPTATSSELECETPSSKPKTKDKEKSEKYKKLRSCSTTTRRDNYKKTFPRKSLKPTRKKKNIKKRKIIAKVSRNNRSKQRKTKSEAIKPSTSKGKAPRSLKRRKKKIFRGKWMNLTDPVIKKLQSTIHRRVTKSNIAAKRTRGKQQLKNYSAPFPRAAGRRNIAKNWGSELCHSDSSEDEIKPTSTSNIYLNTSDVQIKGKHGTGEVPGPSARIPTFLAMIKTAVKDLEPFRLSGKRAISK